MLSAARRLSTGSTVNFALARLWDRAEGKSFVDAGFLRQAKDPFGVEIEKILSPTEGIIHGRRTCVARKPACPVCAVRALCPWPDKTRA